MSSIDAKVGQAGPSLAKIQSLRAVCGQYMTLWTFADRLNSLISQLVGLQEARSTAQLASIVSRLFKQGGSIERAKLWYLDNVSGLMKTFDEKMVDHRILCNKGIMGEVVKLREYKFSENQIENKDGKDNYLYKSLTTGEKVRVKNTLLLPITLHQADSPAAVLEINFRDSKMSNEDSYSVLALSQYIAKSIVSCYDIELNRIAIKYAALTQHAFSLRPELHPAGRSEILPGVLETGRAGGQEALPQQQLQAAFHPKRQTADLWKRVEAVRRGYLVRLSISALE